MSYLDLHRDQAQTVAQSEQLEFLLRFLEVSTTPSSVPRFTQLSTSKPSQNEEP